jgi:hypothetical protein
MFKTSLGKLPWVNSEKGASLFTGGQNLEFGSNDSSSIQGHKHLLAQFGLIM